jgi:hypothetical protein
MRFLPVTTVCPQCGHSVLTGHEAQARLPGNTPATSPLQLPGHVEKLPVTTTTTRYVAGLPRRLTPTDPNGARQWGLSFSLGVILFSFAVVFGTYVIVDEYETEQSLWARASNVNVDETVPTYASATAVDQLAHEAASSPVVTTLEQQIASVHDENAADGAQLNAAPTRNGRTAPRVPTQALASTPHLAAQPMSGKEHAPALPSIEPSAPMHAQAQTQVQAAAQMPQPVQHPMQTQTLTQMLSIEPALERSPDHVWWQALTQPVRPEQRPAQALTQTPSTPPTREKPSGLTAPPAYGQAQAQAAVRQSAPHDQRPQSQAQTPPTATPPARADQHQAQTLAQMRSIERTQDQTLAQMFSLEHTQAPVQAHSQVQPSARTPQRQQTQTQARLPTLPNERTQAHVVTPPQVLAQTQPDRPQPQTLTPRPAPTQTQTQTQTRTHTQTEASASAPLVQTQVQKHAQAHTRARNLPQQSTQIDADALTDTPAPRPRRARPDSPSAQASQSVDSETMTMTPTPGAPIKPSRHAHASKRLSPPRDETSESAIASVQNIEHEPLLDSERQPATSTDPDVVAPGVTAADPAPATAIASLDADPRVTVPSPPSASSENSPDDENTAAPAPTAPAKTRTIKRNGSLSAGTSHDFEPRAAAGNRSSVTDSPAKARPPTHVASTTHKHPTRRVRPAHPTSADAFLAYTLQSYGWYGPPVSAMPAYHAPSLPPEVQSRRWFVLSDQERQLYRGQ